MVGIVATCCVGSGYRAAHAEGGVPGCSLVGRDASGRASARSEDDLDPWDSAAGLLLVREAGGFVSDYRGQDRMFERRQYIAASGSIHSKLQKIVAGALR